MRRRSHLRNLLSASLHGARVPAFELQRAVEEESGRSGPVFDALTQAVREADELFESGRTGGGGTRHWLRDCLLPALDAHGLRVVKK